MKKLTLISIGIAGLGFALSGCGPDQGEAPDPQAEISEESRAEVGAVAPDPHDPEALSLPESGVSPGVGRALALPDATGEELEQRVREELANSEELGLEEQQLEQIQIQVEGRVVALSGNVSDEGAIESVEAAVRDVPGVERVDNNLVASR